MKLDFCTTVLSEEIISPILLDMKQLSSAFQKSHFIECFVFAV